ncbi:hypothetical protein HYH03_006885 [Edaphochlamys debaryana]|uniref:Uncharacterized protein n=1 Tax=Edaphochlamys debaryana TaxID=47281 RepID=A0A836BZR8_9CHLO|nr:hypothetical protein HYH03_006885 [Edaphochlamys debaryana]|eukprot:KAG2494950.1 hypothetical protein HYH03_006885 [Edaphochlamys debaryana]
MVTGQFLTPEDCRQEYNYDEEPLEERVGKYARDHLIIRDEEAAGLGEGGAPGAGGAGPGAGGYHDPYE